MELKTMLEEAYKEKLRIKLDTLKRRIDYQKFGIQQKNKLMTKCPELHKVYDSQIEVSQKDIQKAEEELMELELELNRQQVITSYSR